MFLHWSFPHEHEAPGPDVLVIDLDAPESSPFKGLTAAEREVARLAALGATNAEIARARHTSVRTVANQLAAVFAALGLESRAELVRRAFGGEVHA